MFKHLAKFEKILVTGPQRSGTNICARMIAHDTGHVFVSEDAIAPSDSGLKELNVLFQQDLKFVVHGPYFCRHAHEFAIPGSLIVLMIRDLKSIYESQERVGWRYGQMDLSKQYDSFPVGRLVISQVVQELKEVNPDKIIAGVKYHFWSEYQRLWIKDYLEVSFDSLTEHPLWVPKEQRADFTFHQTKVDEIPEFEEAGNG